ncbi:MAG: signal peptidase I [Nocardioides sp.]
MTGRLREATLWIGAALGLLSVVAGTAVMFFGYTFLIFRSGSMGPEIPTGSLALARTVPAAELEPGDVVSVVAANGARVTHRLVSATEREGTSSLILRGDANSAPDEEVYQTAEAERSIVSVPYLGYVVTLLLSPAGLIGAGCLSGMLLLVGFGSTEATRIPPGADVGGRHRGERPRERRVLVSAAVGVSLAAASVVGLGVSSTSAYFSDTASTSATFSMTVLAPATTVRCDDSGLLVGDAMVVWGAPVGATPTGYRLTYTNSQDSGTISYGAGQSQGRPPTPGSNRTYSVTITALYGGSASVASTPVSISYSRGLLGLLGGWSC